MLISLISLSVLPLGLLFEVKGLFIFKKEKSKIKNY